MTGIPFSGELLFLLSGVYLTYRIRKAQKEVYEEKVTLSIAIILETVASFLMYIIKHSVWSHPELHPDHILTLYFIRCQVTISITICILYFPKASFLLHRRKSDPFLTT